MLINGLEKVSLISPSFYVGKMLNKRSRRDFLHKHKILRIFWHLSQVSWKKMWKKASTNGQKLWKYDNFPCNYRKMVKSKYIFFRLSTNVQKWPKLNFDREIQVRMGCPLLMTPLKVCNSPVFLPFLTLLRYFSSSHQKSKAIGLQEEEKSKSTQNNILPIMPFFYFYFRLLSIFKL